MMNVFAARLGSSRIGSSDVGRAWRQALIAFGCVAMLSSCSKSTDDAQSQVVASVDGDELTESQVNRVLERQTNLKPDQLDSTSHKVVSKLVEQQIVLRKARELKLDRDQRVVQSVESAKRDIIAAAYLDRIADGVAKPSPKDVQVYYDANPALFSERKIYSFQEVSFQADEAQKKDIEAQLTALKTPSELEEILKRRGIAATSSRSSVSAENIPMQLLQRVAGMKPGQGILLPAAGGLRILMLLGVQNSPVAEEQARPVIAAYLVNQRRRTAVEQELAALRSTSKVSYFGKFADLGASTPAAGAASAAEAGRRSAALPDAVGFASTNSNSTNVNSINPNSINPK